MKSWSSTPGRRPTTSAGICLVLDPAAEAAVAEVDGEPAGFALWFSTFSTFRGQPGLYLEDIFVKPSFRGAGSAKGCWPRWRGGPSSADAGGWNGRCSTGTPPRSGFTAPWGHGPWTSGPFTGSMTSRCAGLLRSRRSGEFVDLDREDLCSMSRFVQPHIARMAGYVPGEQPQGGGFIKLNTNENPYPPSPSGQGGARGGGQRSAPALSRPHGDRVPPHGRGAARRRA